MKIRNYPYPLTTLIGALTIYTNYTFYTSPTPANVISYTDHYLYGLASVLMITLTMITFVLETMLRALGL